MNLNQKNVPSVKVPEECNEILKNVFTGEDDSKKEACLLKKHQKLKAYNAYTFNSGVSNNFATATAKTYYVLNNPNAIKANTSGYDFHVGGVKFKLSGSDYDIITMEAPLGADIFADIAWNYNIETMVTLTNDLDNKPEKLIAYRNTTNNRVDLHHLNKIVNKNISDRYRFKNLKGKKLAKGLYLLEAEIQKFSQTRKISQIKFTGWTDDAAITAKKLYALVQTIHAQYHKKGTIAINCFAGVHRTKTVGLALHIYDMGLKGKKINIENLIKEFDEKTSGPLVQENGQQAPSWIKPTEGQWKLIRDFTSMVEKNMNLI